MSRSTARRERPLGTPALTLGVALFVLALIALRPEAARFAVEETADADGEVTAGAGEVDALALSYLRARRLAETPDGAELATALDALLGQARLDEAESLLADFPTYAPDAARRYRLELERAAEAVDGAGGTVDAAARSELETLIGRLRADASLRTAGNLRRAARLSAALDDAALSFSLYETLAASPGAAPVEDYARCGRQLAAAGAHRLATLCFVSAEAHAREPGRRAALRLAWLEQRASATTVPLPDASFAPLLVRGDASEKERETLARVLLLGQRPDVAHRLYIALAEEAPTDAPRRARWLREAARWAEASGEAETALDALERLAAIDGAAAPAELRRLATLAEALWRPDAGITALERLLASGASGEDALERLVRLHELDGRPDRAAAALETAMARQGESVDALETLATLQERHHRYRDALAARERLAARFGDTGAATLARAALHWRLGEPEAALALAGTLATLDPADAPDDYRARLLAELAWRYRRPALAALATTALARIAESDDRTFHGERLLHVLEEAGRHDDARDLAERLWVESGESGFALDALRLSRRAGEDADAALARLDLDADDHARLEAEPDYWIERAAGLLAAGDARGAAAAARRALTLDPSDVYAVDALLWAALETTRAGALRALLDAHRDLARAEPELWPTVAFVALALGDGDESLGWFLPAQERGYAEPALAREYAAALEEAGLADAAARVRDAAAAGALDPLPLTPVPAAAIASDPRSARGDAIRVADPSLPGR